MTSLLNFITPTNLVEEKEKFFSSNSYHPQFSYIWQSELLKYHTSRNLKSQLYEYVTAQNHEKITATAKELFETSLDDQTARSAVDAINNRKNITLTGSAEEYAKLLQQAFDIFKIDYQIEIISKSGFNARPSHSEHKVYISHDIHYEMFSLEGGVHHELVHILRYLNGEYNKVKRSLSYLPTEEGLASYFQDNVHGVIDNGKVQHAAEFMASIVGVKGSLRDVFNYMISIGMSPELAWKRSSRHKFGFVDTSLPGDIIKPAMYYANEVKVANLSSDEKLRLFVGKISLDQLNKFPNYNGLWPADVLNEYFNLQGETL